MKTDLEETLSYFMVVVVLCVVGIVLVLNFAGEIDGW